MKLLKIYLPVAIVSLGIWGCGDNATSETTTVLEDTSTTNTIVAPPVTDNTAVYLDTAMVPVTVRTAFVKKYDQAANVKWMKYQPTEDDYKTVYMDTDLDTSYYQVNYSMNDIDYYAWYSPAGQWVRSSSTISSNDLPEAVINSLKKNYEGYNVVSVDEENYKGGKKYEVKLEKGDDKLKLQVASSGEILKMKNKSK